MLLYLVLFYVVIVFCAAIVRNKLLIRMLLTGVYLWILGQADVMLAEAAPSAKTAFDYEIYMKECHVLWGQGRSQTYAFK